MIGELISFGISKLGGSGKPTQEERQLGLRHPAIDQYLLQADPIYAAAAREAERQHRAQFNGLTFSDNSDHNAVANWVNMVYRSYQANARAAATTTTTTRPATMEFNIEDLARDALRSLVNRVSSSNGGNFPIIPDVGPIPNNALITQTAGPLLGLGGLANMLGGAGRIVGGVLGVVRTVGGRIAGFVLANGRRISVKDAAALAAQVGITAAAATLGASEQEVAEAVLQAMKRRGRRRGISAAALRTTRRTIGQLEAAHKSVARAARAHAGRR